jgi:hypothetical protein
MASTSPATRGAEPEVFLLLAGLLLVILAATASITRAVSGRRFNLFRYMELGWAGALLVPVALVLPAVGGRLQAFTMNLMNTPGDMLRLSFEGRSYTEGCTDGRCPFFCCEHPTGARWKDCDQGCGSVIGASGKLTGKNCQHDVSREPQCAATDTGSGVVVAAKRERTCNHLPELGVIDCTCCSAPSGERFWDCEPNCSSHPDGVQGFPASEAVCKYVAVRHCKNHASTIDTTSNIT